jgi:hypothetical protein
MTDRTLPELSPDDHVQFLDFHKPTMVSGDYELTVTHTITALGVAATPMTPTVKLAFTVAGERTSLPDELVHALFPPEGSEGTYDDLLPHVVLNRSTLPWERQAMPDAPWLALLLYEASEAPATENTTLGAVKAALRLKAESGQHDTDPVVVIREDVRTLRQRLPLASELPELVHVRAVTHDAGAVGADGRWEEQATVIGNRVIEPGRSYLAHLVSVEGRYDGEVSKAVFDAAVTRGTVPLLSLRQWAFRTAAEAPDFVGLLTGLDVQGAEPVRRAAVHRVVEGEVEERHLVGGEAAPRLPVPADLPAAALPWVQVGYVLLPHALRTGDRTVSWYRGPLVPAAPASSSAPLPARGADALLRYDEATGCLDASFAAAWELGRLLALDDARFGVELLHFKQSYRHAVAEADALSRAGHTALVAPRPVPDALPEVVATFFDQLLHLESVPFDYLVPHEDLLPVESLRFFAVDPDWLACLLDGAFSVGRVLRQDALRDEGRLEALVPRPRMHGFLLRSFAVKGFPSLEVDGWSLIGGPLSEEEKAAAHLDPARGRRLPCVRQARLGPSTLLCLFDASAGDLDVLDLHLHPQALHFGFDQTPDGLEKALRRPETGAITEFEVKPTFRARAPGKTLLVDDLAKAMTKIYAKQRWEAFSAGDFALQLLQSPALVRFCRDAARSTDG